jgi:transcriptional regulator with XRE-family HTH domain
VEDPRAIVASVARKLRQLCAKHDVTNEQFAKRSGLSMRTATSLLSGRVNPTVATLAAAANAFGISYWDLHNPDDGPEPVRKSGRPQGAKNKARRGPKVMPPTVK